MSSLHMSQNQKGISSHFQAKAKANLFSNESGPCLRTIFENEFGGREAMMVFLRPWPCTVWYTSAGSTAESTTEAAEVETEAAPASKSDDLERDFLRRLRRAWGRGGGGGETKGDAWGGPGGGGEWPGPAWVKTLFCLGFHHQQ